ncbi:unnamed protein product, partial [Adineta ricciae]
HLAKIKHHTTYNIQTTFLSISISLIFHDYSLFHSSPFERSTTFT